ncbi:hypothetical protein C7B80_01365 [Cyanosarcina cf. burmensis CCALA 770]|nr:hypothetical protein C7B80_01365 [Cyanosarcina cf. burmensis CCALA 770]
MPSKNLRLFTPIAQFPRTSSRLIKALLKKMFVFNQFANGYHQFIQNIRFLKTKKIPHQSLVFTENELATKLMRSIHQSAIFAM